MSEPKNKLVKPGSKWDNDLPAGDAPPMPKWPLVFWGVAYAVWMVFLISMYALRLSDAGGA